MQLLTSGFGHTLMDLHQSLFELFPCIIFIRKPQKPNDQHNPHKKLRQDLTEKKQDLTETSIILMVLTEI